MQEQYDNAFLGILQHEGSIFNFLDAIFSFLYRKTDFYLLMKEKHEKLGFPPGQALKILVNAFRKYEAAARHNAERQLKKQQQAAAAAAATTAAAAAATTAAAAAATTAAAAAATTAAAAKATAGATAPATTAVATVKSVATTAVTATTTEGATTTATTVMTRAAQSQPKDVDNDSVRTPPGSTVHGANCPDGDVSACTEHKSSTSDTSGDTQDRVLVTPADGGQAVGGDSASGVSDRSVGSGDQSETMATGEGVSRQPEKHKSTSKNDEDSDSDFELKRQQATFQANPESYNGAVRDNYSWSQSISDVDIRIEVPKHIAKGRDIRVDIQRKHLTMTYRDVSGEWVTAINGDLTWDINKEECVWTLVPREHVHVNLEKGQERWWEAVLATEPTINVRNIDPSRPMSDLDDEAQAKIQEMMFNERQKQLGLPTSNEQKMQDMLKKAWDADGSPFKGQPFDPSKINLSGSNTLEING